MTQDKDRGGQDSLALMISAREPIEEPVFIVTAKGVSDFFYTNTR